MSQVDPATVLQQSPTVAVVGCSTAPHKDAHRIPEWLQRRGFRVIPVHPTAEEILGETAYPTLADVPESFELVVVFRPSEEAADVTRQAIEAGAKAVWLQLGIVSDEAERLAADAGIDFVQNRCSGVDARSFGVSHD